MSSPTTISQIGGEGGVPFSFTGENNGASLEKIWVWVGEWQIRGVKVWLTDGRNEMFGMQAGQNQEYVFKPGETFTRLTLWGNGQGSRLGAIRFKTSEGGEFFAKMTTWSLKTEYPMDVGSGFCLGVVGKGGSDIDSMGFVFLNAVQSTVLTNVNYPTISQLIPKVTVEELKSITYQNDSSVKQQQKIETSKKVTIQSSWSMSKSFTATFCVEVKAGNPKVVEATPGFGVKVGKESTYRQVNTDERTEKLSTSVEIPPKKKLDVSITIGRSTFELPYTGTVKMTCINGGVLQYEIQGTYNGVTYTDIKVKTKDAL